ncbi:MAG: DUF4421 family protein [Bacteroidota bacterium]
MNWIKLILLFFIPVTLYSQNFDSEYIERMDNTLNMKLSLDNDIESFEYKDEDTKYTVQPNTNIRTTLHANYRFISFKLGFSPRIFSDHDEDNKGKTTVFKIQTDLYYRNWMQTFEYFRIEGYYAENIFETNGLEFIKLPHLKTKTFRSTTRYKFNKNYSLKALLTQTEIQRRSAGSFISSLNYYDTDLTNRDGVQDMHTKGIMVNTGYFYTLVINRSWYSNFGISPGIGVEFNKVNTDTDEGFITDKETGLTGNINTRLGFGYNSSRFYTGLDFRLSAIGRSQKSIADFDTVRGIFNIFMGYRLDAPRLIKDSVDWLEERNPMK